MNQEQVKGQTIILSGIEVIIDAENVDKVIAAGPWHLHTNYRNRLRYFTHVDRVKGARRGKVKKIYLHRFIMNCPSGMEVDHRNGNTLDNRKANLRICEHRQNLCNQGGRAKSGYKGVYHNNSSYKKPWYAKIKVNGKEIHLGSYWTKQEAFAAYCRGSEIYHGEFGRTSMHRLEEIEENLKSRGELKP
jgi:hypothetical protein